MDVQEVIDNPQQYARDYIEAMFVKFYKDFMDTYKIGRKFAKDNLDGSKERL